MKLIPLIKYPQNFYADFLSAASERLADRDEDNIELLALSLKLKVPVWSNDRHFQHSGVETFTTQSPEDSEGITIIWGGLATAMISFPMICERAISIINR